MFEIIDVGHSWIIMFLLVIIFFKISINTRIIVFVSIGLLSIWITVQTKFGEMSRVFHLK